MPKSNNNIKSNLSHNKALSYYIDSSINKMLHGSVDHADDICDYHDISSDDSDLMLYNGDLDPCNFRLSHNPCTDNNSEHISNNAPFHNTDIQSTSPIDFVFDKNLADLQKHTEIDNIPKSLNTIIEPAISIKNAHIVSDKRIQIEGLEYTFSNKESDKFKECHNNTSDVGFDKNIDTYKSMELECFDDYPTYSGNIYEYITKTMKPMETDLNISMYTVNSASNDKHDNLYSNGKSLSLNSEFVTSEIPSNDKISDYNIMKRSDKYELTGHPHDSTMESNDEITYNKNDWNSLQVMISNNGINLIFCLLNCIKIIVGSILQDYDRHKHDTNLVYTYNMLYDETKN